MTEKTIVRKKARLSVTYSLLCLLMCVTIIIFGDGVKRGILDGLSLSVKVIIPTLFPFFILSDLWSEVFVINPSGKTAKYFEKLFGISGIGLSALISGLICGFPVGVKAAAELYENKKITRSELSILSGIVNNPSPAFVISGVGAALLGDVSKGIILYITVVISAIAVGILFRKEKRDSIKTDVISRQNFNLVQSIKNAAASSINVTGYIVFFSALIGLISVIINNRFIIALISPIFEVGNAVSSLSTLTNLDEKIRLSMIAFALGFSGLSVHLQAFSFLPKEILKRKYLLMKITQGLFAGTIVYLFL